MIKLMLNLKRHNNYGFFCPVSKIHLTVSNPIGQTDRITSYILRGIKSQAIVDVDNVIDLATGKVKKETKVEPKEETKEEIVTEEPKKELVSEEPKEDAGAEVEEPAVEIKESAKEETKATRGKASNKKTK